MLATILFSCLALQQDTVKHPQVLWHVAGARGLPAVHEDTIYTGGNALLRVDRETGHVLSAARPTADENGEPRTFIGGPVVHEDRLLARYTDGDVIAYDLPLNHELWTWSAPSSAGLVYPGVLAGDTYLLGAGSDLVALHAADGALLWRQTLPGKILMTPAVDDERVYVGTLAGSFHALNLHDGQVLWTHESPSSFQISSPAVSRGVVYVGDRGVGESSRSEDFNASCDDVEGDRAGALHAFDAVTGTHLWGRIFGVTGLSRPSPTEEYVLAGFGRSVARFDLATGEIDVPKIIRTGTNPFGSPTLIGDRIYFGNLDGSLYVHRLKSGNLLWAFQVPGGQVHDFIHTGDAVYVSSSKGLFALGPGRKAGGGRVVVWEGG